ncbi:MAG TPA: sigma-54 dependent transcriptional regulator [Devosiaceae bacterium]|nr:sigma-54 dependent transcriptional regulator [Devosiaceae bacterium]
MTAGMGTLRQSRILIIDRDPVLARELHKHAERNWAGGAACDHAGGGQNGLQALRRHRYEVIFCDLGALSDIDGNVEAALARVAKLGGGALTLALSQAGSVSTAVAAMRAGAHDYFARPVSVETLFSRLEELGQRHGKRTVAPHRRAGEDVFGFAGFVGRSSQMQVAYEQIGRIATSSAPVFITGESGTGKEVCAVALHKQSQRAGAPFIAINCSAIPRDLMEAELFGVVRGAFTGALEDRRGAAEAANGGMLFIDEIGEIDLSLQAKLLRFLQTGAINRVGEPEPRPVDVRIVCATNKNPMQLIAENRFREDLFYRLHVLPIHLPPLRQRPADVLPLAETFLATCALKEGKQFTGFDNETADMLAGREWPGNVRELQNLVRRIVVMQDGGKVTAAMVAEAEIGGGAPDTETQAPHPAPRSRAVLPLWRQEQRIIEEALVAFGGNISRAAAALEISPSTIYRKRQSWCELQRGTAA